MGIKKDLEENFDYEIVDEFLDHFGLMLEMLDNFILDLLKKESYSSSVNQLFRTFHNIKSATAYLNLELIRRFAKFVEDELEVLRNDEGPAPQEVVDWLILVSDQFKLWRVDLEEDRESLSKLNFKLLKIPDMEDR